MATCFIISKCGLSSRSKLWNQKSLSLLLCPCMWDDGDIFLRTDKWSLLSRPSVLTNGPSVVSMRCISMLWCTQESRKEKERKEEQKGKVMECADWPWHKTWSKVWYMHQYSSCLKQVHSHDIRILWICFKCICLYRRCIFVEVCIMLGPMRIKIVFCMLLCWFSKSACCSDTRQIFFFILTKSCVKMIHHVPQTTPSQFEYWNMAVLSKKMMEGKTPFRPLADFNFVT